MDKHEPKKTLIDGMIEKVFKKFGKGKEKIEKAKKVVFRLKK